jgi:hypothetical protein
MKVIEEKIEVRKPIFYIDSFIRIVNKSFVQDKIYIDVETLDYQTMICFCIICHKGYQLIGLWRWLACTRHVGLPPWETIFFKCMVLFLTLYYLFFFFFSKIMFDKNSR